MAAGPKTRFLREAIENGLESAIKKFPSAFDTAKLAELKALSKKDLMERLQSDLEYQEKIDEGFSG